MKRFQCLVLDANIIILLFQHGLWNEVVKRCELILSETVIEEADFFVDSKGVEHRIDLQPDIQAGRIRVVAIMATEVATFRAQFDPVYVQKLDDGKRSPLPTAFGKATRIGCVPAMPSSSRSCRL
jgi:hypothetical protein